MHHMKKDMRHIIPRIQNPTAYNGCRAYSGCRARRSTVCHCSMAFSMIRCRSEVRTRKKTVLGSITGLFFGSTRGCDDARALGLSVLGSIPTRNPGKSTPTNLSFVSETAAAASKSEVRFQQQQDQTQLSVPSP